MQAQQTYNNAVVGMRNNVVSAENVKAQIAGANAASAQRQRDLARRCRRRRSTRRSTASSRSACSTPVRTRSPSQPVLTISRIDKIWININVPDEDLQYVRAGVPFTYTTTSLPGKVFRGVIQTVNAVPTSGTLSYLARMQADNPGDVLRGGMLITATIPKQSAKNAIVVPRSAVASTENGDIVYAVVDGKGRGDAGEGRRADRHAFTGHSPKITPGTDVITTRPDALKDGSPVQVSGATPEPNPGEKAPKPSTSPSGAPTGQ